jgi:hypothetical protein
LGEHPGGWAIDIDCDNCRACLCERAAEFSAEQSGAARHKRDPAAQVEQSWCESDKIFIGHLVLQAIRWQVSSLEVRAV